jgi:hypothetical protein
MLRKVIIAVAAIIALGAAAVPTDASAYWRGGWHGGYGGWHGGWGYYGGGFAAGAILGGLLAAPYYYGGGPFYYPGPGYYYGPPEEDAVAYCMQRFRSYDPRSGTYLGNDGHRHPCP